MEENIESSVNAESENVVDSPIEQTQPVSSEEVVVAEPQQEEKPQQSQEDNAKFANMRRQIQQESDTRAQKKIDEHYDKTYGKSNGIHSEAKYNEAVRIQDLQAEAEKQGIDPAFYKRFNDMEEENKATKSEKAEYQRQLAQIKEHETLTKDETFSEYYGEHETEIKDNANAWNVDLTTAMMMSIKDNFKAIKEGTTKKVQQDTIKSIIKNGKSSTGSLSQGGGNSNPSVGNMPKEDFNKLLDRVRSGEKIKL